MVAAAVSIGVAAGAELQGIFDDSFDVLLQGEAQYLVSGQPVSISGQISQAAGRSACRIYGADTSRVNVGARQRYENTCRPYLDTLSPGRGPQLGPQGVGGQCAGVAYSFWTQQRLPGSTTDIRRIIPCSDGWYGPLGIRTDTPTPGFEVIFITGQNANGSLREAASSNTGPGGSLRFENVIPCSGGSNACGNPPPQVIAPRPIPNPTGPTFRFNPNANIDVPITVNINPDGTFNFNIGTGPIAIDPFREPTAPTGGGGGGDDPPGDVGEADESGVEDADENGSASGCAGENQVLGGLKIDVTTTPSTAKFYAPGILRGACYLYMGVEGKLDQDFGGSMLRDGQFFLPEKENLTCWEVQANLGFRLRVTPYYKTLEEE